MRVGANFPYDSFPQAPDATRDIFRALNPDSIVIMSHAAAADYYRLFDEFPSLEFTVRTKTGPGHLGTYPSDILDYREWDSERSLADTLFLLQTYGKTLRVILGNEPDIEMAAEPVDDRDNMRQAIDNYVEWYMEEAVKIRRAFPGVQISPAPLSQGNRDRWLAWAMDMHRVFRDADFIAVHCYTPVETNFDDPQWGGQWRWYRSAYADKPICITETDLNGTGDLNDLERAGWMRDYVTAIAAAGEVDEVDIFTLPGGPGDGWAPQWWFINQAMADVIAQANRNPQQQPEPQPEPEPIPEPTPEPEPVPVGAPMARTDNEAIEECRRYLWLAINPGLDVNTDTAIYKYWVNHIEELGSPVSPELPGADNKYQAFARGGIWRWLNDGENTVEKVA